MYLIGRFALATIPLHIYIWPAAPDQFRASYPDAREKTAFVSLFFPFFAADKNLAKGQGRYLSFIATKIDAWLLALPQITKTAKRKYTRRRCIQKPSPAA
jgi:hypothetical protein